MKKYLQYGCGFSCPASFTNFDSSPTLRFERLPVVGRFYTKNVRRFPTDVRYGDIVKGLPVADAEFHGIYCSHVLEHLSLEDLRIALKHTHRYLVPGGIFRLVLPDLEALCRSYLADSRPDANSHFMNAAGFGKKRRPRGLRQFLSGYLGDSDHLWMWDYRGLAAELAAVGFCDIRRAQFGDSADPAFKDVEEHGRWQGALGVECRKK